MLTFIFIVVDEYISGSLLYVWYVFILTVHRSNGPVTCIFYAKYVAGKHTVYCTGNCI